MNVALSLHHQLSYMIKTLILDTELYYRETWELMARRWGKLEKDFRSKDRFDISKIPDIYDCAKYDIQHNFSALNLDVLKELYTYSKYMADLVVPQVRFFLKSITLVKQLC